MTEEDLTRQSPEGEPKKDILQTEVQFITVSGVSGVGKTATCNKLAKLIGFTALKGGELFRLEEQQMTGQSVVGFVPRDIERDLQLDTLMQDVMHNPRTEERYVIEARLAGWLGKKVDDEKKQQEPKKKPKPSNIVKILLFASDAIRFQRIRDRELENDPFLTIREVERKTRERERGDLRQWRLAHPELRLIDPLDRANRDEKGEPIYDLVINTDNLPVDQLAELIYDWLVTQRHFKKNIRKEEKQPLRLPSEGKIFPAV